MDLLKHLPSPIAPTFSEALRIDTRAGSWIFISGQVGVPLPPDKGSVTFEQEVRTTFERIRDSLGKLGAGMNHVVSIKTYLTDLGPYAVFSRIRGEFFPKDERSAHEHRRAGRRPAAEREDRDRRRRLPPRWPRRVKAILALVPRPNPPFGGAISRRRADS